MSESARQEALLEPPVAAPAPVAQPAAAAPAVPAAAGNAAIHRLVTGAPAARPPLPPGGGPLAGGGNRAFGRWIQPKLTVSTPGDRFERQADAVAAEVGLGELPAGPAPAVARLGGPSAAAGDPGADGPPGLSALLTDPGPSTAIPDAVRARIEPHLGVDLSAVPVHAHDRAQVAAAQLGARAFTAGGHIFLGAGESASDLALMAHEATHVVQQQSVGVYRTVLQRSSDSILPDFVLEPIRDLARAVPGYDMLTVVAGYDPIANRTVDRSPENLVRGVLGLVPFGSIVAGKLIELGVLQHAYTLIDGGLTARDLTLARIQREIDQAWAEISIDNGISGNVAIIERHVAGLYADALAFVHGVLDAIVQLIRDAAVGLAETYLAGTPVWDLAKKVLHHDPLRGTPVAATTVEILADFLRLIGKPDTLAQMQERGTLQQTADWVDARIGQFLSLIGELAALFEAGWQAIQPENIGNLADNLGKLARDAVGLVQRVGAFAGEIIAAVLRIIKDALLDWLSREAGGLRGFRLMTVILGQDPFTGRAVPRTAENLIGGFIALLPGGEATYQKLAEAGVIADAAAQIEGAMGRLGISLDLITSTFLGIWNSLTLEDLLNPVAAFVRVLDRFGEPLGRIVAFAAEVLKVVVTLILKLMNFPSDLVGSIVSNAMAAIDDIQRDPVAFFVNMIQALKTGFANFFDGILGHLVAGLADWLFRGLGGLGISRPPDLSFKSILELVLQVLDITAEKLWQKLGDQIGPEAVQRIRTGIGMAGEAFDFVKDVQENGVGAIWRHIEGQLGNLWDTLLGMAKDWIVTTIVERAVAKVLSMLDPTGIMAVVNSAIAFFNAVQSVIEYVREILAIVNDYVSTLAAVAAGNISAGAAKVERGLANAVPVAIGFLANQAGLGNVPEKLVELIEGLRALIDQALDWLFAQAKRLGQAALNALGGGGDDNAADTPQSTAVKARAAAMLQERTRQPFRTRAELDAVAAGVLETLRPDGLRSVVVREKTDAPGTFDIAVAASPEQVVDQGMVIAEGADPKVVAAIKTLHPYKNEEQVKQAVTDLGPVQPALVDAIMTAHAALISPAAIVNIITAVQRRMAETEAETAQITLRTQVYKGGTGTVTLNLDLRNAAQSFLAALLEMSREAAQQDPGPAEQNQHVTVLLANKKEKNFDSDEFFAEVVRKGYRFLDVAVLSAGRYAWTHGATTHLIQDLVVDEALKRAGIAMTSAGLRGQINNPLWINLFDINEPDPLNTALPVINDPNHLYAALRPAVGDLDVVLTQISDTWAKYLAKNEPFYFDRRP